MILTLLSMFGGGLMRLLPEVFSFFNKKTDNAHELAMLDRQFELEKTRATNRLAEVEMTGNFTEMVALLDAQKSALESQMQKTNIWWVDAMNFLVRPLTTYFFLGMYGVAKVAMFFIAFDANLNTWETIVNVYDTEDRAILSGILSFWFVGRVFDKKK